jgi:hypothetical protein
MACAAASAFRFSLSTLIRSWSIRCCSSRRLASSISSSASLASLSLTCPGSCPFPFISLNQALPAMPLNQLCIMTAALTWICVKSRHKVRRKRGRAPAHCVTREGRRLGREKGTQGGSPSSPPSLKPDCTRHAASPPPPPPCTAHGRTVNRLACMP